MGASFIVFGPEPTGVMRRPVTIALAGLAGLAGLTASCGSIRTYDVIIRAGTVLDGSGEPPSRADVAIDGDTIAAVGDLGSAVGRQELDATGLAVAPGFIDMLSWSTESLLVDGRSQAAVRQGVTLEVMGEGVSMGPLNETMRRDMLAGQGDLTYDVPWTTLAEYLEHLEATGVSTNVASFVGATTVRIHEVGYEDRPSTGAELTRMCELVGQAMRDGAMGVGSSLIYAPAFYASAEELAALCAVAGAYGGMYITHMRSEANGLLEGVDEVIDIARASGAAAEIYHLKAAGRDNWHKLDAVVDKIGAARAAGIRLTADMYTYTAGATGLDAAMPPWVQEGGYVEWARRLQDPAVRERVRREMTTPAADWENLFLAAGADKMILVGFKSAALKPLTGKTLAAVAAERGTSPAEAAMDLVIEDGSRVGTVYFLMSEANVRRQIALPWISFGSDAASMASEGVFLESGCHPRAYGNFARLLGRYVRDEQIIPLEEAVRRLTTLPATNLGIDRRGALRPGYFADVAVFDPARIQDHATFEDPHRYSTGMMHVLVNGQLVLRDGEHTGAKPGRVVRGPGWHQRLRRSKRPRPVEFRDDRVGLGFSTVRAARDPSWSVNETNSAGTPAQWRLVAPRGGRSGPPCLRVETGNTGQTYNLLLHSDPRRADLEVAVDVMAGGGLEDQGGGVVWRAVDADNYYVVRWNPLEDNVRAYKVVDGVRTMLRSATLEADRRAWHRLSVRAWGPWMTVRLDGEKLFAVRDETFGSAGRVGLWTKADAGTLFDAFEVGWRQIAHKP